MHKILISLGSNIDPLKNIEKAKQILCKFFKNISFSKIVQTKPIDFLEQPDFLNAVAKIETQKNQAQVKNILNRIEQELGRVRDPNNKAGPRTIDLDIVMFDGKAVGNDYSTKPFIKELVKNLSI